MTQCVSDFQRYEIFRGFVPFSARRDKKTLSLLKTPVTMKQPLAALALLLFSFTTAAAQDYAARTALMDSCTMRAFRAYDRQDYARAERQLQEAIRHFGELPDSVQRQLDEWNNGDFLANGYYYNLACMQSLRHRRRRAVANLERCAEGGYFTRSFDAFARMQRDPDLEAARSTRRYRALAERLRPEYDYLWILRQAGPYNPTETTDSLPPFRYAGPDDPGLARVRKHFNLDSIAGSGDEVSQIIRLMQWAHHVVRHDGSSSNPTSRNAIDLVELCRREGRGINCRMMAQLLNECYLAMGFRSRFVTCMPRVMVNDCHVINAVYAESLGKWVWMDPTFNAYVTDERGTLLGIAEVRERMRDGRPYRLNDDANWNNTVPQTQEEYLDVYMAKNLYYLVCTDRSEYNTETPGEGKQPIRYIALLPTGYDDRSTHHHTTRNANWFWAAPHAE